MTPVDRLSCDRLGSGTVRSFGKTGDKIGQFKDVAGIAADSEGNILVVDACNNRIQVQNLPKKITETSVINGSSLCFYF